MTAPEPDGIVWQTNSYSGPNCDCGEVAPAPDRILVRDSKDRTGPMLLFTANEWDAFLAGVRSGEFDLP